MRSQRSGGSPFRAPEKRTGAGVLEVAALLRWFLLLLLLLLLLLFVLLLLFSCFTGIHAFHLVAKSRLQATDSAAYAMTR